VSGGKREQWRPVALGTLPTKAKGEGEATEENPFDLPLSKQKEWQKAKEAAFE